MDEHSKRTKAQKLRDLRARLDALGRDSPPKPHGEFSRADEVRRALGRPRQPAYPPPTPKPICYPRDLPRSEGLRSAREVRQGARVALEEAVEGREVQTDVGKAFLVSTWVDHLEGAELFSGSFCEKMSPDGSALHERVASACQLEEIRLEDLLFADIETTGLGISPLFLIGTMVWETGRFEVRQYLARNYAEEPGVIALFLEACAQRSVLVTFNGKSFDLPFIRTRATVNGIPFDIEPAHFDLLHACRRIWRGVLPDCRLQTLEALVCGRPRYGDIPGSEIPDAYHAYVRTDDATQIVEILRHNVLDLMTLADLMSRLLPTP